MIYLLSHLEHVDVKSKCPFDDGVYVQTMRTWYKAREDCIRRGTDLYVDENMTTTKCDGTHSNTWIGIRNVRWMVPDKHKTGFIYFFKILLIIQTAQF